MSRNTDTMRYLPDFLRNYAEIRALCAAEDPELTGVWTELKAQLDNQFLDSADEDGISRFEKLLQITPIDGDDLDSRRMRLRSKWVGRRPYTSRRLEEMLSELCGADGFVLTVTPAQYNVDVRVALGVKNQQQIVTQLLKNILPANIVYTVDLLFNLWSMIGENNWNDYKTETWSHLKEDVL